MNENAEAAEVKAEDVAEDVAEERKRERRGVIYQMLMGLCANAAIMGPAMGFGYSAVALGPLLSPTSDLKINETQANWIATVTALGTPVGCIVSSYIMVHGRKLSLFILSLVSVIGWATIYISATYEQILVGRFISGIALGLASTPSTVYVAEISVPKWRNTMVTWTSLAIALAVFIVYILGYVFKDNWRLIALICAIFSLVAMGLVVTLLPESPMWLRDQGRHDEALAILKKFRGSPQNRSVVNSLLSELTPRTDKKKGTIKDLLTRNALLPFAILNTYFFFQQFSGNFVLVYYAVDIVKRAGVTIDPYLGAVLIGLIRLTGSVLIALVSQRFGRRIPSIVSGIGMTIFMGILSMYLLVKDNGYVISDGGLIPVICILMFIFSSALGFLTVPFAMIGEVYPSNVKEILSGLTSCIAYGFSSITVKTYPDMTKAMGDHGVFLFYALMSLIGLLFVLFFLPETKNKTLKEIEEMFTKKKIRLQDNREKERIIETNQIPVNNI